MSVEVPVEFIAHKISNIYYQIFTAVVKSSNSRNSELSFRQLVVAHLSTGKSQKGSRDSVSISDTLKENKTGDVNTLAVRLNRTLVG